MALLNGISDSGFFNFWEMRDLTTSTACNGASSTAAAGPELAGEGAAAAGAGAGAEDDAGAEDELGVDNSPPDAGAASSSMTGSTS